MVDKERGSFILEVGEGTDVISVGLFHQREFRVYSVRVISEVIFR
jgi:hypothetical protein